jgi:hypothetical protein
MLKPKTSAITAAQSVNTGTRFTITHLLFPSFSAIDLIPSVTKNYAPKPIYFFRPSLFSRLKPTSLCNSAPDHDAT